MFQHLLRPGGPRALRGAKILKIIKQNEIASFLNFNVIDLKVKQIINGKIQFRSKSSFFQIQV